MSYNRTFKKNKAEKIKGIIKEKVDGKIIPKHDEFGHHYQFVKTGKIVDSVTTQLNWLAKPHLIMWAVKLGVEWLEVGDRFEKLKNVSTREDIIKGAKLAHTDVRDDAGKVGTQAHNAIEEYLKEWIKSGQKPSDIRLFLKHEKGDTFFGTYLPELNITISDDTRAVAGARAAEKIMSEMNIVPLAAEILVGEESLSAGTLDFLCLKDDKVTILDWKTSNSVDEVSYPMQVSAYKRFFEKMTRIKVEELIIMKLSKENNSFEEYIVPNMDKAFLGFKSLCSLYNNWLSLAKEEKLIKNKKVLKI